MFSEISQREKDKYCMIYLVCGIKKIQQSSKYNKKEIDSQVIENKVVVTSVGERQDSSKGLRDRNTTYKIRDFPGCPVVRNLPCNAGDASSIPGPGTKISHAAEQLSPHASTTELVRHQRRVCTTMKDPT